MTHRPYISFLLASLLALAACTSPADDITSAAMDIYNQYNDHSATLTVAYVGDYQKNGTTYNAVMFHTDDTTEWQWLCQEFGILSIDEVQTARAAAPLTTRADGHPGPQPAGAGADTSHGVIMGTLEIDPTRDFKDTAEFLAYIDSLTFEMLRQTYGDSLARIRMRPVSIMNLDSMPDEMPATKVAAHQAIAKFTRQHGSVSYLVNVDYDNHTLWLFFYDEKNT